MTTHQFGELSELAEFFRQGHELVVAGDEHFEWQTAQVSRQSGHLITTAETHTHTHSSENASLTSPSHVCSTQ